MGSRPPPGKSCVAVHKRAIPLRRYGPAHILSASCMTLPINPMTASARILPRLIPRGGLAAVLLVALASVLSGCGESPRQQAAPAPPKVTVAKTAQRTIVDQDEYLGRFVGCDVRGMRCTVATY